MPRIAEIAKPPRTLLVWACANAFRAEDLADFVTLFGDRLGPSDGAAPRATARLLALGRRDVEVTPADLTFAERELLRAMIRFIEAGRAYWIPRIQDLRKLRDSGRPCPEGSLVADLVPFMRRPTRQV